MPNPRLAARYAKSLIDLSQEQGKLEAVFADMQYLFQLCAQSPELVNLLKSPVIKSDKKIKILEALTTGKIDNLTNAFVTLLAKKGREGELSEMTRSFVKQYQTLKGIHPVKLTTATPAGDALKQLIVEKVKSAKGWEHVELETVVDEKIIGGFLLEMESQLMDASILHDLRAVKRQFDKNLFVQNIR
ncbi:MAG: ATP synthase F1 subunit delta [Bacteroidota bacterium]|jgi:F-type H+-transporting ATPase subunit delta